MKEFILSFVVLFAALSSNAQILYKVSGNNIKGDSYVMGTHHLAPLSILDSIEGFESALKSVDAVYGEIEQSEMNSQTTQQMMMAIAMAPADSTLSKVLTKEQFDSIDNVLKKYSGGQATLNMFEPMKPALVSQQIALLMNMQAIPGFNPMQLLDTQVQLLGSQNGKEVNGFETVDFQLNMLFGNPIAEQVEDLLDAIRDEEKMAKFSIELYQAYMNQEIEKLHELMQNPELGMEPEDEKEMLTDRNENWAKQLATILPNKSVFICVGAGHLPGEKGLLNLLRQAGYTITPVK